MQPEAPAEALEESDPEPIESYGDAAAPEELEADAAALDDSADASSYVNGAVEEILPEESTALEPPEEDVWTSDPAIAGSGAVPDWAKPAPAPLAPEPITTYTGPPGFNTIPAKATAISQVRTNSRAGRFRDADSKGVILPPTASGLSSMEMQFGSLSFGGQGGDGVELPEPVAHKPESPKAPPAPVQPITSPIRAPIAPAQAPQPAPPTHAPPPLPSSHPYYSQTSAPPVPQQQPSYTSPHQTLQQQMHAYQSQYGQQAQAQQQQQQPSPAPPAQSQVPSQQQGYYGRQDVYGIGSQAQHQQHQQHQQQADVPSQAPQSQQPSQQQSSQQQHVTSPYDAPFGGFGQSQLYGQQAQQAQAPASDPYGQAQRVRTTNGGRE